MTYGASQARGPIGAVATGAALKDKKTKHFLKKGQQIKLKNESMDSGIRCQTLLKVFVK